MKLPYLQFFIGDWIKDPKLSLCTPATRGVWIDLLCAMHELDRAGELRGTTEQLARLARCSPVELEAALTDLQTSEAAGVHQRNGGWVLVNFRMKRKAEISAIRATSGSKRSAKPKQNPEYGIEYENGSEKKRKERAADLGEVLTFCREIGLTRADAEWFWHKCEGNGWLNGGKPILDWKATLRSWKAGGYVPSIKNPERGKPPRARTEQATKRYEPPPSQPVADPVAEADFQRRLSEWQAAGRPLGEFPL